ncbi:MAG TPA: helix-turn-helix transcriptional regulator, partial [Candidatus Deferrimicrobium sp.]|nr:helix-turn-helix transcriptional regulator [Candidatus Deferrimicrobium sp.]
MTISATQTPEESWAMAVTFRESRRQVGLSQAQLAELLCVNHATISRWESGIRRPAHDMVPRVAEALRVRPSAVAAWFEHIPVLGGDTVGSLPGLKRLFVQRGIDVHIASRACGVSKEEMAGWVHGRRSLPRFMVPRLATLLDMTESQFRLESRIS